MTPAAPFQARFWGVRGSIPTPQRENLGYGGNTACVEIRQTDQPRLILDAGSGLRLLGLKLNAELPGAEARAHIFLSHLHWDHIQGIPFFEPLYTPGWSLTFYSQWDAGYLEDALRRQLRKPYFPVESAVKAALEFRQVGPGPVRIGELDITAFPVSHPDACSGFRIDTPRGSVVYATDHEHGAAAADANLRRHSRGATALIYDAQFTPEEYERYRGWGHSTWREGIRVAADAAVERLVLFHHDPCRTDAALDRVVEEAAAEFPAVSAAREGSCILL